MLMSMQTTNGVTVVQINRGRLDAAVAHDFRAWMHDIIDQGHTRLLLDLQRVEFIDSSGLGSVVGVLKYLTGRGSLEIVGINPTVLKVFQLTRMDSVFVIRDRLPVR